MTEVATAEADGGKMFVIDSGSVLKGLLIRGCLACTGVTGWVRLVAMGFGSSLSGFFNFFETLFPIDASFNIFELTIVLSVVKRLWICDIGSTLLNIKGEDGRPIDLKVWVLAKFLVVLGPSVEDLW